MEIYSNLDETEKKLKEFSDTMCFAKWSQVSLHLTNGMTHSCYHPPVHSISIDDIKKNPSALHNTKQKILERTQMLNGLRPEGCNYCWKIEDLGKRSDRLYKSNEYWAIQSLKDIERVKLGNINPTYVEVNFNQTCNFKCMYCSPHLSSSWEEEILEFGPYEIIRHDGFQAHNDINSLSNKKLMPIKVSNKDNPYLEAFWKWWPALYKKLFVFRMTGGEPLLDNNTYKILDYVNEVPNAFLELSITSNFCPPKKQIIEKFIEKVLNIEKIRYWKESRINPNTGNNAYISSACKNISLFISLDSVGQQAEYIRSGLVFDELINNVDSFLSQTMNTTITFINTFNALSVPKLKNFLEYILELRSKNSKEKQGVKYIPVEIIEYQKLVTHPPQKVEPKQRIWFDVPLLENPNWFEINILPKQYSTYLEQSLDFMRQHTNTENFVGFYDFEINKVERNLSYFLNQRIEDEEELKIRHWNFRHYLEQYDNRKKYDFSKVFPELKQFYNSI
jgi:organic radical activating enzyme